MTMPIRTDSEFNYNPLVITDISGDNGIFKITFETRTKEKYRITFNNVWDLRYSIENANLDRNYEVKSGSKSDISIIENSDLIASYKGNTLEFVQGIESLKHYYITDGTDTVIDILEDDYPNAEKPKIEKVEDKVSENI